MTDRCRPIARLIAVKHDERAELHRELLLRSRQLRAPLAMLPADFWTRARADDATGRALAVLLEERESGR